MVPVAESTGSRYVVEAPSVLHPMGQPTAPTEEERLYRRKLLERALEHLQSA